MLIKMRQFNSVYLRLTKNQQIFDTILTHQTCIICLENISIFTNEKDNLDLQSENIILDCMHVYHTSCFQKWYVINENCPHCREKV